jgi:hypothetical protein
MEYVHEVINELSLKMKNLDSYLHLEDKLDIFGLIDDAEKTIDSKIFADMLSPIQKRIVWKFLKFLINNNE